MNTEDMACVGREPEMWFSEKPEHIEYAKNVCASCKVIQACKAAAFEAEGGLDSRGRYGIYGGMTATERSTEHRKAIRARGREPRVSQKLTKAEWDNRYRMVVDEGLSDMEVALIEGVTRDMIYRWRQRHEIPTSHPREPNTERQRVEMWRAGESDRNIGAAVGISQQAVRRWRRNRGYGDNQGLPVVPNRDRVSA